MEGSEDDAGAATNASRRASAREKDVQQSEDGGAHDGMPPDAVEAAAAGDTASMSEEVFDGDSVPSPSTHDVNTSTEAILDMIDEIVDGPDAPKRRPRSSGDASNDEICASTSDSTDCPQNLPTVSIVDPPQPPLSSHSIVISRETVSQETVPENLSENVQCDIQVGCSSNSIVESVATVAEASVESRCNTETEYTTHSESTSDVNTPNVSSRSPSDIQVDCESHNPESAGSEQASSSMNLRGDGAAESTLPNENAAVCLDPEVPTECPPSNVPSSSVVEIVQSVSDTSDIQNCERTLKCVTSSDNRENVTVESAESTSNDSSVSEYRAAAVEPVSRSPLRRRLVRPAPIDRRPDSTVSSTVDSQIVNIHTTKQTSSESVAKDVSSSSDAVPHAYGNFKPEEIRNVSEISVCKAETSGSSPKKIRLVRQKITPPVMLKDNIPEKPILIPETVQCQSISSESIPSASAEPVSSDITRALVVENENTNLIDESVSNESNAKIPEPIESPAQTSSFKESANVEPLPGSSAPPEKENTNKNEDQQKVPPIKLNLNTSNSTDTVANVENTDQQLDGGCSSKVRQETPELTKAVPKLTIKLGNKPSEEAKSPVPKLTIKPIKPPAPLEVTKLDSHEQIPSVTKINIKPIPRPPEKLNDIHRKSSSSEISESESSENDESNSTSDQTSTSDQGSSNVVPKVTIKLGKPGTESEGKFYTQQNIPKLTIKGIQHSENEDQESTLKLVISQSEDKQMEKIPKLTIKTVTKSESQPLSPKLTIKPLKPPENIISESTSDQVTVQSIPKLKISTDPSSTNPDLKENTHVPKITIKPVIKTDNECTSKTSKKSAVVCDSPDHIPVVTKLNIKPVLKPSESVVNSESLEEKLPIISKLNIKPILKPTECNETSEEPNEKVPVVSKLNIKPILKPVDKTEVSENMEDNIPVVLKLNIKPILKPTESGETSDGIEDKVPVVSKLNIKPIIKPKDDSLEDSTDNVPKITKLNIKPLKAPEEGRDCDEIKADTLENNIPIITKLNIKPIIKPVEEEDTLKDSENQSSETGNSSDDNTDHIPVVTKLNIKPILRPNDSEESAKTNTSEDNIPVVTKLNIKPLIKPEDNKSPSSPKKDILKLTKLTIKPIVKPQDNEQQKHKNENDDVPGKNPPLVMKINMKAMADMSGNESLSYVDKNVNNIDDNRQHIYNNVSENIPVVSKLNIKAITKPPDIDIPQLIPSNTEHIVMNCKPSSSCTVKPNCLPNIKEDPKARIIEEISEHLPKNIEENLTTDSESSKQNVCDNIKSPSRTTTAISLTSDNLEVLHSSQENEISESKKPINTNIKTPGEPALSHSAIKLQSSLQNCTLLKKLLETKKDGLDKRLETKIHANHSPSLPKTELTIHKEVENCDQNLSEKEYSEISHKNEKGRSPCQGNVNSQGTNTLIPLNLSKEPSESLTKPLEINVPEKVTIQSSGQDSPRIILKINKTDHGASAKIITEETRRGDTPPRKEMSDNTQEIVNDKQNLKKIVNSRKKQVPDMTPNVPMGKRLRSSRIVDSAEKTPIIKRNIAKRASSTETSPEQVKEPELSVLESKRLKLGQLLSNKSLTITPVPSKVAQVSPPKSNLEIKQGTKTVNHSHLNNENCAKNGNSKLHNILSNLQAKQAQALAFSESNQPEKKSIIPELDCSASTGSSDVVEILPVENSHPAVQEMIIAENSASHDFVIITDDVSQDPLEVETSKIIIDTAISPIIPKPVEMTPQPKKRGRPRKVPMSEGAKPLQPTLPIPALEERPQRSLRLSRDRPAILVKPRGRGRGRGKRQAVPSPPQQSEPLVETASKFFVEELKTPEEIDPTSSRIKLPRMTEALDKMPASVTTPLTSRRRNSSATDLKLFADAPELKVVLSTLPKMDELSVKSPETPTGRGGRGSRGGRGRGRGPGRSPRGRGRGRGGGRGAMYMKETMGIYGRVCGPATTTVQLFEEETCMMDDNATPAKPSHLLDEDSQSSVKSSTNESSKMKKSKFEDLFDSNKLWTAADVKEYVWPPPGTPDVEHQVMMIQEQVAMFLGVKSFKRRYPELKRRTVGGEERDYVLSQGLVTEALCDLGITAVDASEVLDIMLSDYPHKYEEYRSHQRERQRAEASSAETTQETKPEAKVDRVEMKVEMKSVETKPEPSKIDLEKSRLDMAVAAIASASEWNTRMNALRRGACVDLQSMSVHRRRAPPRGTPPSHVRPPAGFYPHALLPGQYQHTYRHYTPEQLRYFPLNTTVAAPPAPPSPLPSSSDSEPEWGSSSSSEDSATDRLPAKRKKLTKTKRSSQAEVSVKEEPREEVETCRACKLRLEANRKYTHERFLVCANCNAKLHPSCVELGADTIRKCREYAWQCAECKTCCSCQLPADDDKMLFCDLCDRGFHIYCVGLDKVPSGRWHCVECAKCKSCGSRDPSGPSASGSSGVPVTPGTPVGSITPAGGNEWHHQTRRGPGGHKVYSHSLCTPCARAYRIGRYCPLCERSFIGPKGTMQLVICKLCDRQHHQDCVRQTVSHLKVLDYTCGECRRGGITSRAAAVRLAPRTIATLFMAKRRFNKYAHRQYMQSRMQGQPKGGPSDLSNDLVDDPAETSLSCEPEPVMPDDAADVSDASDTPEVSDPLEGAGEGPKDETATAVASIRMDFGD